MRRPQLRGCGRPIVVIGLLVLANGACGDEPTGRAEGPAPATRPSPFTVDLDVAGYRAVTAGAGTEAQLWGEDSGGTDEPVLALRQAGTTGADGLVLVSVTGFENQQGGLSQSAAGYTEDLVEVTVDGRDGYFTPAGEDRRGPRWADLVVAVGDDLAIRVMGQDLTQAELEALLRATTPQGRSRAPKVDLPDGYERIGRADAEVAIADRSYVSPNTDGVPGSPSALGVGWTGGTDEARQHLALVTMAGGALELDAVAAMAAADVIEDPTATWREVEGRRRYLLIEAQPEERTANRTIWMELAWGDVAMVRSVADRPLSERRLLDLVLGIAQADEAAWEDLVIEATGGPGLHPDDGRVEVARGTVGDIEWLMQTGPPEIYGAPEEIEGTEGDFIDPCLKLSNRQRACGGGGGGSNGDWILSVPDPDRPVPPYVLLSTTLDAAAVRVTTRTDQVTAPLHQVAGQDLWGAVVFVDDPGNAGGCDDYPPGTVPLDHEFLSMRVDALDAEGNVIACLGYGPGSHEGGI